jgi:hypothetical protein
MSDDDLRDFRAQGLEGGDKRLNSSVAIHRALSFTNSSHHCFLKLLPL